MESEIVYETIKGVLNRARGEQVSIFLMSVPYPLIGTVISNNATIVKLREDTPAKDCHILIDKIVAVVRGVENATI